MLHRPFTAAAAAVAIITTAACSTTATPGRGATAGSGAEAPVGAQVAVFRTLFSSNASGLQGSAHAYCIGTGRGTDTGDVDPAVLAALRDEPKVRPRSACVIGDAGSGVTDRDSGRRSLIFTVSTASCASREDCLLSGGYYEGNISSQTNRYRARLVNGAWTVTLDEMGPIS